MFCMIIMLDAQNSWKFLLPLPIWCNPGTINFKLQINWICYFVFFQIVKQSDSDKVTVIGAGITLAEAVEAYKLLAAEGTNIRVIDPFTIKPIDKDTILASAKATGGKIITVEDHYPEGKCFGVLAVL